MKYSKNTKLNTLLNAIEEDIIYHFENDIKIAVDELNRYKNSFPKEPDYNFAQYGNLLCYYGDIYELYRTAGYKTTDKYSPEKIWETYKRQTGFVIREILKCGEQ